jgi:hypothetical protein
MEVADVAVEKERALEEVRGEEDTETALEADCRLGCDGSSKEMTNFVGGIGLLEGSGMV